jgi:hypothetical protein
VKAIAGWEGAPGVRKTTLANQVAYTSALMALCNSRRTTDLTGPCSVRSIPQVLGDRALACSASRSAKAQHVTGMYMDNSHYRNGSGV